MVAEGIVSFREAILIAAKNGPISVEMEDLGADGKEHTHKNKAMGLGLVTFSSLFRFHRVNEFSDVVVEIFCLCTEENST